ncbi:class I SAM-dependent methyltransferase family protein [Halorussus limi]|uniref:Class I SAM-dependent methyltransferase family protein n=1 Tax=Halorussus limi TaxID=2938695 RepID=A0A8U0HQX8_9EURY|nr:class I SAM-dependent methyltransferase family protein [Halorussus limi]UPV73251.1 class I SAM-dependent methyltransferase family protein [Halorussus limi]
MEVPCVRVERERGEETRRRLADRGLLAAEFEIEVEDGFLYLPVTDAEAVPEELEVVSRSVGERETPDAPADLLGFEPTYERLGDIVIVDEDDPATAREIADAVMASDVPAKTVVNRASKVKGELRVRDWEVLVGDGTETVHREYGCEYLLDVAEVYFSPRLATERHRVAEQVSADERAFDMFAGVGPFVVPFAKRGAEVVGVDLNERAVEYLRENARRNDVADRVTAIQGDVRDVVSGSSRPQGSDGIREIAPDYADWADRVVMNLPHSADEFLDSAVELAGDDCVIHYYDIQHEDDPFGPGEAAIRAAADPEYEVDVETRHVVRSYAPHELNVCLDVRLSR